MSGQHGVSPRTAGRKVTTLTVAEADCWGGWVHGEKGQQENCVHLECSDMGVQDGRAGSEAAGAGMALLSPFVKEMRCARRDHEICICCQQGHGEDVTQHDSV